MARLDYSAGKASGKNWSAHWTFKQTLAIAAFVLVSAAIPALITLAGKPPGQRLGTVVVYSLFAVFLFVMVRFEKAVRIYERFVASYFRLTAVLFITTLPLLLFYWLSRNLLASLPLWLQTACFIVWGVLLSAVLLLIATKKRRAHLLSKLKNFNLAFPAIYSFQVLMLCCFFHRSVWSW